MKIFKYLAVSVAVAFIISFTANAQYLPGTIDMMPSMNATTTNAITAARNRILSGNSRPMTPAERAEVNRNKAIEQRGMQIIKSGKANNTFIPSLAGSKLILENLTWDKDGPQDGAGRIHLVQSWISQFNGLMRQNQLTVNDVADGVVLAHALSYMATYDRNLNPQELKQYQINKRNEFLQAAFFQGYSDPSKQQFYENYAILAIQAINYRLQAKQEANKMKREQLVEKAKRFAQGLLN